MDRAGDEEAEAGLATVVWGTGNMGRAAIRAVLGNPLLSLAAVVAHSPTNVGIDAAEVAGVPEPTGVLTTDDVDAVLAAQPRAVAYMASGDVRPAEAVDEIERCLRAGAHVVTPSVYALYDPRSAPQELVDRLGGACEWGGASLFVSGVDPGWANDLLPAMLTGLCAEVSSVRCQEIFDYSTYDQPEAVRYRVGMGQPMDEVPLMVAPSVPTMVWGGGVRMIARALGVEIDEIREVLERRPLERTVTNVMGTFDEGTQGALRFEVQGIVAGEPRIVIEHVTRIDPDCAPDWPQPPSGAGAHRVVIEGSPRLEVTIEAEEEDGNRAAGGNATAAARLVGAIPWLDGEPPGLTDALDVPIEPGWGRMPAGRPRRR